MYGRPTGGAASRRARWCAASVRCAVDCLGGGARGLKWSPMQKRQGAVKNTVNAALGALQELVRSRPRMCSGRSWARAARISGRPVGTVPGSLSRRRPGGALLRKTRGSFCSSSSVHGSGNIAERMGADNPLLPSQGLATPRPCFPGSDRASPPLGCGGRSVCRASRSPSRLIRSPTLSPSYGGGRRRSLRSTAAPLCRQLDDLTPVSALGYDVGHEPSLGKEDDRRAGSRTPVIRTCARRFMVNIRTACRDRAA